jgi:hypothetical protein
MGHRLNPGVGGNTDIAQHAVWPDANLVPKLHLTLKDTAVVDLDILTATKPAADVNSSGVGE